MESEWIETLQVLNNVMKCQFSPADFAHAQSSFESQKETKISSNIKNIIGKGWYIYPRLSTSR